LATSRRTVSLALPAKRVKWAVSSLKTSVSIAGSGDGEVPRWPPHADATSSANAIATDWASNGRRAVTGPFSVPPGASSIEMTLTAGLFARDLADQGGRRAPIARHAARSRPLSPKTATSSRGCPLLLMPLVAMVSVFRSADRVRRFIAIPFPPLLNVLSPLFASMRFIMMVSASGLPVTACSLPSDAPVISQC
jgi:hypothetical protein